MLQPRNNDARVFGLGIVGFVILWILAFAASLGLTGVIIWAIIQLVQHFTSN